MELRPDTMVNAVRDSNGNWTMHWWVHDRVLCEAELHGEEWIDFDDDPPDAAQICVTCSGILYSKLLGLQTPAQSGGKANSDGG